VGLKGQKRQGSPAPHHHFPPSPPETPLTVVASSRAAPAFSYPVAGPPCQSRISTADNPRYRHPATASTAPALPEPHRPAQDSAACLPSGPPPLLWPGTAGAPPHPVATTGGAPDSPWPETSTTGAPPPAITSDLNQARRGGQEDPIAFFILVWGLCVRVQILGQAQLIWPNKHTAKLSLGRLTRANKHTTNSHVSLAEVRYLRWDNKSEVDRPTKHTLSGPSLLRTSHNLYSFFLFLVFFSFSLLCFLSTLHIPFYITVLILLLL
jgi:hypothetical protein